MPRFAPTRNRDDTATSTEIPPPATMLDNGLGGFSADGREYVIRIDGTRRTPLPWVNVIANPRFGSVVSEAGSAYTWMDNAHEYRLSPWSNDPVCDAGGEAFVSRGTVHTIIGLVGDTARFQGLELQQLEGVDHVIQVGKPYKMVARDLHPETTPVKIGSASIGRDSFTLIAGPCAVESEEQALAASRAAADAGATVLRGGAYKPRTSPYSFQGLGERGLEILSRRRTSPVMGSTNSISLPPESAINNSRPPGARTRWCTSRSAGMRRSSVRVATSRIEMLESPELRT